MSTIDLKSASKEDLRAALAAKEAEEKRETEKLKTAHLKRKEEFLFSTINRFESYHHELKQLKEFTITEANKIWNEMYEIEGRLPKEQKQISITSDNYKITVEGKPKFVFTDEADVHIEAIQEYFRDKYEQRNKGLYGYLDDLLIKNTKGDYDPKLLTRARTRALKNGDDELLVLLDKLQNCQAIVGTALYCRVYKKNEKGAGKDIVIQFSSL